MAFDIHLHHVMSELLPNGCFPPPDQNGLEEYLKWDDWRVLGLLAEGEGGPHAKRILGRDQYRQVYRSKDRTQKYEEFLREELKAESALALLRESGIEAEMKTSKNSWYKVTDGSAITIVNESNPKELGPLSEYSPIASLNAGTQYFIYVKKQDVTKATQLINTMPEIAKGLQSRPDVPKSETPKTETLTKKPVSVENQLSKKPDNQSKDVTGA